MKEGLDPPDDDSTIMEKAPTGAFKPTTFEGKITKKTKQESEVVKTSHPDNCHANITLTICKSFHLMSPGKEIMANEDETLLAKYAAFPTVGCISNCRMQCWKNISRWKGRGLNFTLQIRIACQGD